MIVLKISYNSFAFNYFALFIDFIICPHNYSQGYNHFTDPKVNPK